MAVPKRRTSKTKTKQRRSQKQLTPFQLSIEEITGEYHRSHHISPSGYYKGRKVIDKD